MHRVIALLSEMNVAGEGVDKVPLVGQQIRAIFGDQ